MSRPISRPAIVRALLKKELVAYSRDLVFLVLTLFLLVAIPFAFHALPDPADESITLAVYSPMTEMLGEARETVLRDKEAGEKKPEDAERIRPDIGIAFPDGFIAGVAAGQSDLTVTVYSQAGVGEEIQTAMQSFVREAAYQIAGRELPVGIPDEETIVLGEDRMGDQVTMQERMRPLLLFMVLLMETFSMASLVSTEVLQRTVTAVLVTPVKASEVLIAKWLLGVILAVVLAAASLALNGAFGAN